MSRRLRSQIQPPLGEQWMYFFYDHPEQTAAPDLEELTIFIADPRAAEYLWMPDAGWMDLYGNFNMLILEDLL